MNKIDCALLVRDLGDAYGLSPLAHTLREQGKEVRILALGQAAHGALQHDTRLKDILLTPDMVAGVRSRLGTAPGDLGGGQGHDRSLHVRGDAMALAKALQAPVVVTGVVSRAQADIVAAMRAQRAADSALSIVGFYDSLALNKNCYLFKAASLAADQLKGPGAARLGAHPAFAAQLDEIWVPLAGLVAGVAHAAGLPKNRVVTVGSPSTEATLRGLAELALNRAAIRLDKLGATPEDRVVFYAGGRDSPGNTTYATSFNTFVHAAMLASPPKKGKYVFVVGLHPASEGLIERETLSRWGAESSVRLLRTVANPVTPQEVSTNELVVACDVLATWNSTVASQAALMPRRSVTRDVLFIDGGDLADQFAVVVDHLAAQVRNTDDVVNIFEGDAELESANAGMQLRTDESSVQAMRKRLSRLAHAPY